VELGTLMLDHEKYMRRAIELAGNVPGLPFASLIVDQDTGEVLSEGWNKSSINPTWHGEIVAINKMTEADYDWKATTLALYTTAEPCPMCQGAIHWTGIETVVFGASIRFLQQLGWKQIDILAEEVAQRTPFSKCTLIGGILEKDCNSLFEAASRQHRK
jgi:tRNA(Arg) A34 adenosine deaminase TadA